MQTRILAATVVATLAACASAPVGEHAKLSEAELAKIETVIMRDFHAAGQAKMDRMKQDDVQRTCNLHADNPPASVAQPLEAAQLKAIKYPSGSLLGDWRKGRQIAESGRGMQWHEDPKKPSGGGCYNCHELSPQQESHGTLGPSLKGFGKVRGYTLEMQRYAYGKIYNAKAYNLCSHMPRFGHSGTLTEQQIKDVTAYLMDPNSPVNQ